MPELPPDVLGPQVRTHIKLEIALPEAWRCGEAEVLDKVRARVEEQCNELLAELGLSIAATLGAAARYMPTGQLSIGSEQHEWRCAHITALRAMSVVQRKPLYYLSRSDLSRQVGEAFANCAGDWVEWIAVCCRETLRRRPGALITSEIAACFLPVSTEVSATSVENTSTVLSLMLEAGVPLAEQARIQDAAARMTDNGDDPYITAEALINELNPRRFQIGISIDYLTKIIPKESNSALSRARTELFEHTGLRFPEAEFVFDYNRGGNTFQFVINGVRGLAWVGLPAGNYLIGPLPAASSLAAGLPLNPLELQAASIAGGEDIADASGNRPFCTELEYLGLCLRREVIDNGERFVDATFVRNILHDVYASNRALSTSVTSIYGEYKTAIILRQLAAERISLRNITPVFEAMLRFGNVPPEPVSGLSDGPGAESSADFDSGGRAMLAFVRRSLGYALLSDHIVAARGLRVLRVNDETERTLTDLVGQKSADIQSAMLRRLDHRLSDALTGMPVSGLDLQEFCVLTDVDSRPWIRKALSGGFPDVPVYADDEIDEEVTLESIGTIGFEAQPVR